MEGRKGKRGLRLGVLGMVLCMVADWLLDIMPAGNVSNVLVESGWVEMRFEASILIAAAIIPLFWLGIRVITIIGNPLVAAALAGIMLLFF